MHYSKKVLIVPTLLEVWLFVCLWGGVLYLCVFRMVCWNFDIDIIWPRPNFEDVLAQIKQLPILNEDKTR